MTPVTVSVKIRVVLIELHRLTTETLVSAISCPLDNPLARPVMNDKVFQRSAFRRGVLRMRMVVVEPRAVRQHQIALHVVKGKRPMPVALREFVFFFVLRQPGRTKSPRIFMRIFTSIVPTPLERRRQMRTDQLHRFHDGIDFVQILARDAILCFNAEKRHA